MALKRVNYHLTDNQIEKLKELSDDDGRSVAELIRNAVDDYLEKRKSEEPKHSNRPN